MTIRSDNYAPVLPVNVSRPYFSTRPQGACEKFGVWGRDYITCSTAQEKVGGRGRAGGEGGERKGIEKSNERRGVREEE